MRLASLFAATAIGCLPVTGLAQYAPAAPRETAPPASASSEAGADSPEVGQPESQMRHELDSLYRAEQALARQEVGRPERHEDKGAWIGVSASPAPAALRHQLRLPEGIGLLVDFVQPKSPADQAGLRQYDVLHKLDDQLLINLEQFSVLVRTYKSGDEVRLTVIRDGQPQTLTVKLVEHELSPLSEPPGWWAPVIPAVPPKPIDPKLDYRWINPAPDGNQPPVTLDFPERSITWLDGEHQITINTRAGHSVMVVTDKDGKVVFRGPVDSERDRSALPDDVRDALKHLKFFSDEPGRKPSEDAKAPPRTSTPENHTTVRDR